jgi:hypothetical protein
MTWSHDPMYGNIEIPIIFKLLFHIIPVKVQIKKELRTTRLTLII